MVPRDGQFRAFYVRGDDDKIEWKVLERDDAFRARGYKYAIQEYANDPKWPVTRGFGALWYSRSMYSLS
jgi:hypothetical protein